MYALCFYTLKTKPKIQLFQYFSGVDKLRALIGEYFGAQRPHFTTKLGKAGNWKLPKRQRGGAEHYGTLRGTAGRLNFAIVTWNPPYFGGLSNQPTKRPIKKYATERINQSMHHSMNQSMIRSTNRRPRESMSE